MRFVDEKNNEVRFTESFNVIKDKNSPVRSIGNADKPTNFSYHPESVISSDNLFQLKVNTKSVGTFLFAFEIKNFNREGLIDKVSLLKKIEVDDKESALKKVEKLKEAVVEFNPVFTVYSNPDVYGLTPEEAKEIFEGMVFFYVENEGTEEIQEIEIHEESSKEEVAAEEVPAKEVVEVQEDTEEEKPAEEPVVEEKKSEKAEQVSIWAKIGNTLKSFGKIITDDKWNFVFALIASTLIGFTLGVGLYNAYLGKYICIFFFVSTLVGMALNAFVYRDTIVDHKVKSQHMIVNLITSVIGLGISIGGYFLFVYITKEKANPAPHILLIIAVQLMCLAASIGISFLLAKFNKKKKKK